MEFSKNLSTRAINKTRRNSIKDHFKSPLLQVCVNLAEEKKIAMKDHYDKNYHACFKVVTNAIFCFKNSMSSMDFLKLNSKDEMVSPPATCATKNDGPQQFFYFRLISIFVNLSVLYKRINFFRQNVSYFPFLIDLKYRKESKLFNLSSKVFFL